MATSNETIETREHGLYLKYLLLLGKATPIALKVVIKDIETKQTKPLASIIEEMKEAFSIDYNETYLVLFEEHTVNTRIDSWDIAVFCDVLFVLLGNPELEIIQCIRDHRTDIEIYTESASLDYKTFKEKWDSLLKAINELIDHREGEDKYVCKRLIHSYDESKMNGLKINVSKGVIDEMKQTNVLNEHIDIAKKNESRLMLNEDIGSHIDCSENELSNTAERTDLPTQFIKQLEDTLVNINEAVVLVCELDTANNQVEWKKNRELLEETDTLKYFTKENTHLLHITAAMAEDTGTYSCSYRNVSTSAFLQVFEHNLEIIEHLHVVEEDIKEDREITLACKVNKEATKPQWFHNGKAITPCPRVQASSQGHEHKLIIHRARVHDGGEYLVVFYRVAGHTSIIVQDSFDLGLKHQLTKKDYRNWVRGVLGMKYLKLGLENVSEDAVKRHHEEILKNLKTTKQCNLCNENNLKPNHSKKDCSRKYKNKCLCSKPQRHRNICPTGGYCSVFYDLIVDEHRYEDPCLGNTNIARWGSEPWSVATCYINTNGYKGKISAREVDCAGLLSLFLNNKTYLQSVDDCVFRMAKDIRNQLFHNANYELSEHMLIKYLDHFKRVLEDVKKDPSAHTHANYQFMDACIQELEKLKTHQFEINLADELQELKDHAMKEDAGIIEKADEQKETELEHLAERLQQTGEELKLIGRLRSTPKKSKTLFQKVGIKQNSTKVPLDLELCIMIYIRGTTELPKETIKLVFGFMWAEVEHHNKQKNITQLDDNKDGPAKVIYRLLQTIFITEGTLVQEVQSETGTGVSLKIRCGSSKSIEKLLVVFHGKEFQKCIQDLKKCLAEEKKDGKTEYDIEAICSSRSMNDIREELVNNGTLEGNNYDYRCEKHDGTLNTWYCCDHDTFCCSACVEHSHRSCPTRKQVIPNSTYNKLIQRSLSVKHKKGYYYSTYDADIKYVINRMCVLPNGEILFCDNNNTNLKKLDTSYRLVSYVSLPGALCDMCYIGSGKAVVLLKDKLGFVEVSGDLSTERFDQLDHIVDCLACHGDTLYTCVQDTVRLRKTDGTEESDLCKIQSIGDKAARHMAVSDDGEKIYITNGECLIVINNKGNDLHFFKTNELNIPSHVCCVEDGSVLVCDAQSGIVLQVDTVSKKVVRTFVTQNDLVLMASIVRPTALCYDRKNSKLVVGYRGSHFISVFELQHDVLE